MGVVITVMTSVVNVVVAVVSVPVSISAIIAGEYKCGECGDKCDSR